MIKAAQKAADDAEACVLQAREALGITDDVEVDTGPVAVIQAFAVRARVAANDMTKGACTKAEAERLLKNATTAGNNAAQAMALADYPESSGPSGVRRKPPRMQASVSHMRPYTLAQCGKRGCRPAWL